MAYRLITVFHNQLEYLSCGLHHHSMNIIFVILFRKQITNNPFLLTGKLMVEYKLLPEFTTLAKELQIRKLTSLLENAGVHEKLTPLLENAGVHEKLTPLFEKHSSVHAQKRTASFSDCLRQGSDSGFLVTSTPLKADGVHCFEAGLQGESEGSKQTPRT